MGRDSTRVSHYAPRPIIHARDRVAAIARVGESKRAISTSSANRNAPWVSGEDRAKKQRSREKALAAKKRARDALFARRVARARRRRATTREARGRDRRERASSIDRARANGRTDARTDGGRRTC
jgi:hypothetical protein